MSSSWRTTNKRVKKLTSVNKVVFQNGHKTGHLTEEKHPMFGGLQLGQDTVKELKLPTYTVQVGTSDETAGVAQVFHKRLLMLQVKTP